MAVDLGFEPALQTLLGLGAERIGLACLAVGGEGRKDGLPLRRHDGAAPRDRHGVVHGLRQVGEERAHLVRRAEEMLRGQVAPVLVLDVAVLGHAEQGVVGLVGLGAEEVDVVGRNQRQVELVGERDQVRLDLLLFREAVAHQLDVEPAWEDLPESRHELARGLDLAVEEETPDRAGGPARERQQALRPRGQLVQGDERLAACAALDEGVAGQRHQVAVASLVLGEKQQPGNRAALLSRLVGARTDGEIAADDGLHARPAACLREGQRAEHVAAIGDGDGWHPPFAAGLDELLEPDRALQQRIGGTNPEMNEIGVCHGATIANRCRTQTPD